MSKHNQHSVLGVFEAHSANELNGEMVHTTLRPGTPCSKDSSWRPPSSRTNATHQQCQSMLYIVMLLR